VLSWGHVWVVGGRWGRGGGGGGGGGCTDWIELAQDKDRWRTLVNVVMNLKVP
jgi:hypothetical protein